MSWRKKVVKANSYWLRKSVCSVEPHCSKEGKQHVHLTCYVPCCLRVWLLPSEYEWDCVFFPISFLQGVCWQRHAATANWVDSSLLASSWQPPCISPWASQLLVALSACVRILHLNPLVNSVSSFVAASWEHFKKYRFITRELQIQSTVAVKLE